MTERFRRHRLDQSGEELCVQNEDKTKINGEISLKNRPTNRWNELVIKQYTDSAPHTERH